VSKKRRARGVIGNKHRVTREEAMKWFQQKVSAFDFTDHELTDTVYVGCVISVNSAYFLCAGYNKRTVVGSVELTL